MTSKKAGLMGRGLFGSGFKAVQPLLTTGQPIEPHLEASTIPLLSSPENEKRERVKGDGASTTTTMGSRSESEDQSTFDLHYSPPNTVDFATQEVLATLAAADDVADQIASQEAGVTRADGKQQGSIKRLITLGSVLERLTVSSMIRYTTLMYVLRDSPQRSVHLAVRAWDDLLETAARADLTRRDPQGDEPAAERDVTGRIGSTRLKSIYIK
ncbi:unnamed protein product [Brassica oleracea var. botrytis]